MRLNVERTHQYENARAAICEKIIIFDDRSIVVNDEIVYSKCVAQAPDGSRQMEIVQQHRNHFAFEDIFRRLHTQYEHQIRRAQGQQ